MRLLGPAIAVFVLPLMAQESPSKAELLEALGNAAATFSRTAPGLGARETLAQRGRVASVDILKGSEKDLKKIAVRLPDGFTSHEVESEWSLAPASPLHEVRIVKSVDAIPVKDQSARHAMTIGQQTPDDEAKKQLLEDLEQGKLQGAAADFVPMILLFTTPRQSNYEFVYAGQKAIENEPMLVLEYRQIAGEDSFTEFRNRFEKHHPAQGQIWLRQSDLLPLRVTLSTRDQLSVRYSIRNEAEVNYTPTRFGLAPATVFHRQFVNDDLLVENDFRYSDYSGRVAVP